VTAIYMPSRTLAEFSARAIEAGIDPDMPAIAVRNATRRDEVVVTSTVRNVAREVQAAGGQGPLIVLVGKSLLSAAEAEAKRARAGRQC
jgi:uroporphyrin-III C-methyltransferase / precorrin-2 dehydrogenase / sirohydrochlorin ferrochelatase